MITYICNTKSFLKSTKKPNCWESNMQGEPRGHRNVTITHRYYSENSEWSLELILEQRGQHQTRGRHSIPYVNSTRKA